MFLHMLYMHVYTYVMTYRMIRKTAEWCFNDKNLLHKQHGQIVTYCTNFMQFAVLSVG